MSDPILLDQPRPGITRITLNRPDNMNTLTVELVDALHEALTAIHNDHNCRAVVLTGAGRAFCAGLDLKGYGTIPGTESFGGPQQGMAVQQHIAEIVHKMRSIRQPIVAAINGAAAAAGLLGHVRVTFATAVTTRNLARHSFVLAYQDATSV